jgi:hypothetical protein
VHVVEAMDERRADDDRLEAIEGADPAALGTTPPPEPGPADAQEPVREGRFPGPVFGERVAREAKPWFTSLAAESGQAGVANDPPDAQEPEFPDQDDGRD